MSLLFPEKLRIHLAPDHVLAARTSRFAILESKARIIASNAGHESTKILEALAVMLDEYEKMPATTTVTLSSRLAPASVLPWRDDATTPGQQALLAAARLSASHGGAAADWNCISESNGFGRPWVATGVQHEFIAALKSTLSNARVGVTSIVPLAVDLFNVHRASLPVRGAAWLLVSESDRLVGWYCQGRIPLDCVSLPLPAEGDEPIDALLRREVLLRGLPDALPVLFVTASHPLGPLADRSVQRLFPRWRCEPGVTAAYPLHWLGGAK